MTRLFIDRELAPDLRLTLTGDRAHYLLRVLRARPGTEFTGIDPTGRRSLLRIEECGEDALEAVVVSVAEPAPDTRPDLHLYAAALKGGNFDLVIQKATELGVGRITPIITARTVSRPPKERVDKRVRRWQTIAEEACRQCGRGNVPAVDAPLQWQEALAEWREARTPGIIPYEALAGEDEHSLRAILMETKPLRSLAAFIGPEGGFTPQEIDEATAAGVRPVSLGPLILRAETASVALCAIVMYEMETER